MPVGREPVNLSTRDFDIHTVAVPYQTRPAICEARKIYQDSIANLSVVFRPAPAVWNSCAGPCS